MNEILFSFLSFSPGPFWLILVFFPTNKKTMRAFDLFLILLSTIFSILTIPLIPELIAVVASPKLSFFQKFLSSELGTVGSWNHMILGDLWIGRWVIHDAIQNNVSLLIRLPILFLILFFGPVGLFFYLLYRILFLKKLWLTSDS
jgi:hypothetical protein